MDNPYMQKNYPMTQSMKVVFCSKLFKNDCCLFPSIYQASKSLNNELKILCFFKDAAGDTVTSCDYVQESGSSAWKLFYRCCCNIRISQRSIFL